MAEWRPSDQTLGPALEMEVLVEPCSACVALQIGLPAQSRIPINQIALWPMRGPSPRAA